VNVHLDGLGWRPEIILSSFHGVPQRYLKLGDPYHCHCQKTARLLRAQLGLAEHELQITFQSRFGLEAWLQPYTDETIATLAKRGVKNLAVISPAFISDCVETLEELAIGGREIFLEAGGKNFTVIPCLNDSPAGMNLIENLVRRELSGWI
jgi:ferrochelatase